jgi:hypothetical protein
MSDRRTIMINVYRNPYTMHVGESSARAFMNGSEYGGQLIESRVNAPWGD